MMNNEISTRIIKAVAKLVNCRTDQLYIRLFSDGRGSLVFCSNVSYVNSYRPSWCTSRVVNTTGDFVVFNIFDWNIEDAFIVWYERHFETKFKSIKLYNILEMVEHNDS